MPPDPALVEQIRKEYKALGVDKRRQWVIDKINKLGRGGASTVQAATGIARTTIRRWLRNEPSEASFEGRQPHRGPGRPAAGDRDSGLVAALNRLLEPQGPDNDPPLLLQWTTKGTRQLASELTENGHPVGATAVLQLLKQQGFSVEANRRTCKGQSKPNRDARFRRILQLVKTQRASNDPAIMIEMLASPTSGSGQAANFGGKGKPAEHYPWQPAGVDPNTIAFTVAATYHWWKLVWAPYHPNASSVLLVANDCDKVWNPSVQVVLQRLSDALKLKIIVGVLPTGTSKWSAAECQLRSGLRGNSSRRSPMTHCLNVHLIGTDVSQTSAPLEVEIDAQQLESLGHVSEEERLAVRFQSSRVGGVSNFTMLPRPQFRLQMERYFRATTYAHE